MRGALNRLSDTRVESLIRSARKEAVAGMGKPKLVADGGGLYLQITKTSSASWLFRYTRNGRAVGLGLGGYPAVGLKAARIRAADCRSHLEFGRDPLAEKRQAQLVERLNLGKDKTFDYCAAQYIKVHREEWKNPKHIQQWENTLASYASPLIGTRPVGDITTEEVRRILSPIWTSKNETATRLRGRMEAVFDWATVHQLRQGENPARWKGHLEYLLPRISAETRKSKHFSALPYLQIGAFLTELAQQEGMARWALEFLILTASRTSEVTHARYSEIDLHRKLWIIPKERMKAHREHRVPLSESAVSILNAVQPFRNGEFVFPGGKKDAPLSNMAMAMLLRRVGYSDITVHGFRSTFRDWISETTTHEFQVAEAALAHQPSSKVVQAYMRGDMLDKRIVLMADWASYCSKRGSLD